MLRVVVGFATLAFFVVFTWSRFEQHAVLSGSFSFFVVTADAIYF